MQKVLEGDPLLIRDVYGYIITHLLARPYALGLLRIMGLKLAERKDWGLISDMGKLIIEQKDPYFSTVQLAALLNYLAYLSIKHNKGSEHIKHCMDPYGQQFTFSDDPGPSNEVFSVPHRTRVRKTEL